jgi:hypothetical protein
VDEHDIADWQDRISRGIAPRFPFPQLGDYCPPGWELLTELFVDSLGWDLFDAGGPALSIAEFINRLEPGAGYGITDVGQFQLYVGVFRETD